MRTLIFQTLEFTVLIPGMLLAYLPVRSSLKQTPKKLAVWILPLLLYALVFVVLHAIDSICQQDLFFFLFYLFYLFYIITLC